MSWRRSYSVFSKEPLTYETLASRCKHFHIRKTHPAAEIQDYILANRKLQKVNRVLDPSFRYGSLGVNLGLKLNVSSTQLERELWRFLRKYWAQCVASDDVVKTYVSTGPGGHTGQSFRLVKENFHYNLTRRRRTSIGPITALIHVLLRENDFHGCFKLVDDTVSSKRLVDFRRRELLKDFLWVGSSSMCVGFLGCLCYSISVNWGNLGASVLIREVLAVWPLISLSFVSGGGVFAGLKWLKTSDLPRVLWRPHTSVLYRLLHGEEALLVNKVVTYFEEYNEVNVKNFHLSQVRPSPRLNVFDTNDYELFMPEIPASPQGSVSKENDAATEALTRYFRSELHRRKMVWRPLKEEQMFLDFWVNHGDNYEWVEPDQDPAEMAVLESMCVPTKE